MTRRGRIRTNNQSRRAEPIKLKQNFKTKVYKTQKTLEQKTNMDQTGTNWDRQADLIHKDQVSETGSVKEEEKLQNKTGNKTQTQNDNKGSKQ